MQVRLFGRLADHAGSILTLPAAGDGRSVGEVRDLIAAEHPALGAALGGPGVRACVGRAFVTADHRLGAADQLEFWPPVSGG